MTNENDRFSDGDLRIERVVAGDTVRLVWSGKSNARDPGAALQPYFESIAQGAQGHAAVELALGALEYFNSSTLTAIIRGIRHFRLQNLRVIVSYRQSSGWQRRSCEALRILESDGVVEIRHE